MQLGDKQLVVQLACANQQRHNTNLPNSASAIAGIDLSQGAGRATEILCLMNMVTEDELKADDEYEEILEDVRDECSKYGIVRSLEIPRPYEDHPVPGVGKVEEIGKIKIIGDFWAKNRENRLKLTLKSLKMGNFGLKNSKNVIFEKEIVKIGRNWPKKCEFWTILT